MPETDSNDLNSEIRRIVDAARGNWIRRLIDYSRANSLLFYRDLKVGTLDLTGKNDAVRRLLTGEALTVDSLVSTSSLGENPDAVLQNQAEDESRQKVRNALVPLQRKALSNLRGEGYRDAPFGNGNGNVAGVRPRPALQRSRAVAPSQNPGTRSDG
jgi:hypothetical protein